MSRSASWNSSEARRHVAAALLVIVAVGGCDAGRAANPPTGIAASAEPAPSVGGQSRLPDAALPTPLPESVLTREPTRVRVPRLDIDLPVIRPAGPEVFPYCDVAEYLPTMSRPGRPGTTYLYAHARVGMFLPILEASLVRDGRSMVGMRVDVFTSDDRRFIYEVVEVRRHVRSLDSAYRTAVEQLILQTSEGPRGTPGKTMLIALPRGERAATATDAHPEPKPVRCV